MLCPAQNPASIPLLQFARRHEWMALHALSQCTARVLMSEQLDDEGFKADWEIVRGLAQLGMEERAKGGWYVFHCRSDAIAVNVLTADFGYQAR